MTDENNGRGMSITLKGREVPITRKMLEHMNLRYYPENPRVYSIVHRNGDDEPDQEIIEHELQKMDHVKQLVQAIKQNGGLTDPLLVRGIDRVVLEGNSRLAAYRLLSKNNPVQWGQVKCDVIEVEIDDVEVTTLLSHYHIIGRKSWDPFEQAGMFWRWHCEGVSLDDISQRVDEIGISSKKIRHWIEVYSMMVYHNDTDPSRWSYYDEFIKSREIKKVREEHPEIAKVFVKKVKKGEIGKAVDVRDKLKQVCKTGGHILSDFIEEKHSLDSCFDRVVAQGGTDALYNKMLRFREVIAAPETKKNLQSLTAQLRKKYTFELSQIQKHAEKLLKTLGEE